MTTDGHPGHLLTPASCDTPLIGLIVKMSNYAIIELAGHLNFDFVLIDTEHGVGGGLVSRVVSDFTVRVRDNGVCLLLRRLCCVLVMSRD